MRRIIVLIMIFSFINALPGRALSKDTSFIILLKEAETLFFKKDYYAAEGKCEEAINLNPKLFPAYNLLGNIYGSSNREEQAARAFEKSIGLNPSQPDVYDKLAFLYDKLGDTDKTIRCLEESVSLRNGDLASYYDKLGLIYFLKKKDHQKAFEYFNKLSGKYKDDPKYLYFKGACYLLSGKNLLAMECVTGLRALGNQYLSAVLEDYLKRSSTGVTITTDEIALLYNEQESRATKRE
ncbi:MAG: tetratricopeptide repeat protein [Candidatus Omnitrophica bacterium]|nr:tetratricopeptide repeat protein [Candidatus Omnitrophota bacterium]